MCHPQSMVPSSRAIGRRWRGPPRRGGARRSRQREWPRWVRTLWADAQLEDAPDCVWGDCCVRFCMQHLRPGVLSFRDYVAGAVIATEYAHPALDIRHHAGRDAPAAVTTTPNAWGTAAATVAHALRWRYPRASYVFRRVRHDIERRLRAGEPIDLPAEGYGLLVNHRDHAVLVDHDGWCWSHGEPPRRLTTPGVLRDTDLLEVTDPAPRRWELYTVRPPSEWEVARTSDGTPRGIALRPRWHALRRLLHTHTGEEGCRVHTMQNE